MKRKAHHITIHTKADGKEIFTCVDQDGEHLHVLTGDTVTWIWAGHNDFWFSGERSPFSGEVRSHAGIATGEITAEYAETDAKMNHYGYVMEQARAAGCDPEIIVDPPDYDRYRNW